MTTILEAQVSGQSLITHLVAGYLNCSLSAWEELSLQIQTQEGQLGMLCKLVCFVCFSKHQYSLLSWRIIDSKLVKSKLMGFSSNESETKIMENPLIIDYAAT